MKLKSILLTAAATISLATATMAQVPNYVPTNGLVGWWPFNGNANDESGNGNNGTVNGATLASDRNGNANASMDFLQNQYIEIQSLYQNNIGGYTISAWFKKSPTNANTDGAVVSGSYPGQAPGGLRLNLATINRFQWQAEDSPGQNGIIQMAPGDNNNYCDNNWHFVVSTFSSPNGLISASAFKIYIDGSLIQTISNNTV
jgi:trimeric autotransporter adhesin